MYLPRSPFRHMVALDAGIHDGAPTPLADAPDEFEETFDALKKHVEQSVRNRGELARRVPDDP